MLFPAILLGFLARADALDDAANQWIKKIQGRLAADEAARITWNDAIPVDSASAAYLGRAKTLMARGLQRRLRNPKFIDVAATWSQDLSEYLLIAEIKHDSGNVVEMVSVPRQAAENIPTTAVRLDKHVIWAQETRILDLTLMNDHLLVLDTVGVTHYQRSDGKWEPIAKLAIDAPTSRDARGRLTVTDDTIEAEVSGVACRGTWKASLQLECQPGGRFTAGGNTMEENGMAPFFMRAEWNGQSLVSETDGQTHVYDASHKLVGMFEGWGSDFSVVSGCPTPLILAAGAENRASDQVALYELRKREPERVGDQVELPGPITALWPFTNGALAVVRTSTARTSSTPNPTSDRYEAYNLSVDCSR